MENRLQQTIETTREFKIQLLQHITNNFSEEHVIGRGGYGVVYKGMLEDGEEIAVKRLHHLPGLDDKEFRNEFNNLIRAQHKNIVRLIGYCYDIGHQRIKLNGEYIFAHFEERILCLEYLEGGSLDKYVSDGSCGLDWQTCYVIIRGVSEGLNYLHNGSKDPIFHLDLKPANVLLNKGMMPKIGDFGLSRFCPSGKTCTTIKIIGTPGYMPPEYIERCQITSKFDIFSLGVIIIQIMAGREGYFKLVDMTSQEFIKLVHENWLKRLGTAVSSHTSHEVKRCIEIALTCVDVDRVKRPTIAEVVDELNKIDTSDGSPPGQGSLGPKQVPPVIVRKYSL
ncbi:cysteine-rich receptor-like protein kinase 44 [Lolium rigidum]|uniref:cysteine-rich receptor-like protein kinase 44 n=1 Tax=Lolium rigidum TaxID=89674 RepID=UPI001F5DC0B2|nr:cysteine-rich receptor-like protein kinase 44 [Lolium rigidum]